MQKEEFLQRTGLTEVSDDEYRKVERAFEVLPNLDERRFCELYVNNQPHLLQEYAIEIEDLRDNLEAIKSAMAEICQLVTAKAADFEILEKISSAIGHRPVIIWKLNFSEELTDDELKYVKKHLK